MDSEVGVFSESDLLNLIDSGRIRTNSGFDAKHVGPASIDLTVTGTDMYQVEKLFRPRRDGKETVYDMLKMMGARSIQLGHEMVPGHEYLFKASISPNLSPGLQGRANAKSTSGRNFILSRTIADNLGQFDAVGKSNDGYSGDIWIVLQPLVYPIILTQKECYNQIRFYDKSTKLNEDELRSMLQHHDFFHRRDTAPYPQGKLYPDSGDGSILCTLYAKGGELVGFRAKKTRRALDLSSPKGSIDPREYFEPVYAEEAVKGDPDSGFIHIRANEHLLLSTGPMVKIPENYCAELYALDPSLGLFFSHFAGFIDPGFFGTITLEVVAPYDMVLRHKDPVARLVLERMRNKTLSYREKGNYNEQILTTLPKQFAPWR